MKDKPVILDLIYKPLSEEATSKCASRHGIPMVLSTYSNTSLEDVIACRQDGAASPYWFQLYVYKERSISEKLVRRAERAGYQALVVTVDTPLLGKRLHDARTKFQLPPPWHIPHMDTILTSTTTSVGRLGGRLVELGEHRVAAVRDKYENCSQRNHDGRGHGDGRPVRCGRSGRVESWGKAVGWGFGYGGLHDIWTNWTNIVTGVIDALPEVVRAARGRLEVYLDGGIRRGTDVFKALALGAEAVLIGRPVLWGLAYGGEAGLNQVIGILNDEFRLAMALAGCSSISEITPEHLAHISEYTTVRPKL
ncbi:hypothetical protein BC938DRAFT_477172 [Jimgerdemannia flammicorona]|uniref:FMN hydroxy acid dehydrogenase domain-containing protein n=1 Tax=Jimgerdemannia flammicorona TaxID=994334 RepID=A0A433QPQ6_9FUNG|nr:hypothetical protein BC938DRAFT_477172 [Jimgerdemannia flammicorona]